MAIAALPCVPPFCIPDALNPFYYIASGLSDVWASAWSLGRKGLVKPYTPSTGSTVDHIVGEGNGLLSWWPYIVAIIITAALWFPRRFGTNLFQAAWVGALIGLFTSADFTIWDQLIHQRKVWATEILRGDWFGNPKGVAFGEPSYIATIVIMAVMLFYTIGLLIYLFIESLAIPFVKALTAPAIMLIPLGDKGKRAASTVLAGGFVATFAGGVIGAIAIAIARLFASGYGHKHWLFVDMVVIAALRIAMKSQRQMYEGLKRAAFVRMVGSLSGRSLVGGDVNAKAKQAFDVNVRKDASRSHSKTMPVPVQIVDQKQQESRLRRAGRFVSREGAIAAAAYAGTKFAERSTPAAAAATHVAGRAQERLKGKRGRR